MTRRARSQVAAAYSIQPKWRCFCPVARSPLAAPPSSPAAKASSREFLRQADDVVHARPLAPAQHPPAAKARVPPEDDIHRGQRLPQPLHQQLEDGPGMTWRRRCCSAANKPPATVRRRRHRAAKSTSRRSSRGSGGPPAGRAPDHRWHRSRGSTRCGALRKGGDELLEQDLVKADGRARDPRAARAGRSVESLASAFVRSTAVCQARSCRRVS